MTSTTDTPNSYPASGAPQSADSAPDSAPSAPANPSYPTGPAYSDPAHSVPADSGHAYPGPAYSGPAYAGGTASAGPVEPKPLSLTSFWLGIASVVFSFTLFVPVAAIVLSFLARTREPVGRVYAIWGIVLGSVMALGWALALVAFGGIALATLPFVALF